MKRSEAMDKLREAVAAHDADTNVYRKASGWHGIEQALRDLINAEDDLPWRMGVIGVGTIAASDSKLLRDFEEYTDYYCNPITGPTQPVDHGEEEQTKCNPHDDFPVKMHESDHIPDAGQMVPRLVPVTEQIVEVDGKYYRIEQ